MLCQRKCILNILENAGLLGCKPVSTPLRPGLVLSQGKDERLPEPDSYQRLVGQLLYLSLPRPDLSQATQQLSKFVSRPTKSHWNAAIHVLKYLKGCPSLGLFISSTNNLQLLAYSDVDWGSCIDTRRSLTGHCVSIGSTLLSWRCKK